MHFFVFLFLSPFGVTLCIKFRWFCILCGVRFINIYTQFFTAFQCTFEDFWDGLVGTRKANRILKNVSSWQKHCHPIGPADRAGISKKTFFFFVWGGPGVILVIFLCHPSPQQKHRMTGPWTRMIILSSCPHAQACTIQNTSRTH